MKPMSTGRTALRLGALLLIPSLISGCASPRPVATRGGPEEWAAQGLPVPPVASGTVIRAPHVPPSRAAVHPLALSATVQRHGLFRGLSGSPARESVRTLSATGGWISNGAYRSLVCVGQGAPCGRIQSPGNTQASGFLDDFLMYAACDFDGDGIPDEDDRDDDGDGIEDLQEIRGWSLNPSVRTDPLAYDTDGDGASDGAEFAAGTNPNDKLSALDIVKCDADGNRTYLRWKSRGGYQYEILRAAEVGDLTQGEVVGTVTAIGGRAPWFDTESEASWAETGKEPVFYGIRIVPVTH